MTILEAVGSKHQYDVGIFATEEDGKLKWYWDINGGYCSVGSHDYFDSPEEAYKSLLEFIPHFKPFEK